MVRCSYHSLNHFKSKYHHLFWKSASLNKIAQRDIRESEGGEVLREKKANFSKAGSISLASKGGPGVGGC